MSLKDHLTDSRVSKELQHLSGQYFAGSLPKLVLGLALELSLLWLGPFLFYKLSLFEGTIFWLVSGLWILIVSAISTYFAQKGRVFQRSSFLTALLLVSMVAAQLYFSVDIPLGYYVATFLLMFLGYRSGWTLRTRNN